MKATKELVIAVYHENINWINTINSVDQITIYNKGGRDIPGSIPLPNVGREAHTFLYHIVNRYNSLADFTIFLQGDPFYGHMQGVNGTNFNEKLKNHTFNLNGPEPVFWPGDQLIFDDVFGKPCYEEIFEEPWPGQVYFAPGAQWIVPQTNILYRSLDFYKYLLDNTLRGGKHHEDGAINPWTLERMWGYIFEKNLKTKL